MKKYILQNSGDEQQAEDIFHDIIIKLIVKVRKNELPESTNVKAYVFTACKNAWLTKAKRDQKINYSDEIRDESKAESLEQGYLDSEKQQMMEEMLTSLGEPCKELLKLTFYLDHSLKEAAKILGLSGADVARTYQYRCKKKLIEKVKKNKAFIALMKP